MIDVSEVRTGTSSRSLLWQRTLAPLATRWAHSLEEMPRDKALQIGVRWGRVGFAVARKQRRVAERNLALAYGDSLTPAERTAMVRRVFEHFGLTTVEFLRSRTYGPEILESLVVEKENYERYVVPTFRGGGGVLAITAHLGNFELFARWVGANDFPLTVVVRDPGDPTLGKLIREIRESGGYQVVSRGSSTRQLFKTLQTGGVVGILPDQNSSEVFVPFFGVPAGTPAGPAHLALRTGAPMVPAFCVRRPDNRYKLFFGEPIHAEATGDKEGDVARTMTRVNQAIEDAVRRYPDQYLWLHNRWKCAFQEQHRARWPAGYDVDAQRARWQAG